MSRRSRNDYEASSMSYDHKRCVRETLAFRGWYRGRYYYGTSMLEFADRIGYTADSVDLGNVSLRLVHEDTGVPYEKMIELGRN